MSTATRDTDIFLHSIIKHEIVDGEILLKCKFSNGQSTFMRWRSIDEIREIDPRKVGFFLTELKLTTMSTTSRPQEIIGGVGYDYTSVRNLISGVLDLNIALVKLDPAREEDKEVDFLKETSRLVVEDCKEIVKRAIAKINDQETKLLHARAAHMREMDLMRKNADMQENLKLLFEGYDKAKKERDGKDGKMAGIVEDMKKLCVIVRDKIQPALAGVPKI